MQPYFLQPDSTPSPLPATDVGCQVSEHLIGAKETRLVRLENDWMPVETFPYAWFWQEMYGSEGFPWYKSSYVMAVEPSTSWPAHGLVNVNKETGTQRILGARETIETELKVVFYASKVGVERISPGGAVIFKQEQ